MSTCCQVAGWERLNVQETPTTGLACLWKLGVSARTELSLFPFSRGTVSASSLHASSPFLLLPGHTSLRSPENLAGFLGACVCPMVASSASPPAFFPRTHRRSKSRPSMIPSCLTLPNPFLASAGPFWGKRSGRKGSSAPRCCVGGCDTVWWERGLRTVPGLLVGVWFISGFGGGAGTVKCSSCMDSLFWEGGLVSD